MADKSKSLRESLIKSGLLNEDQVRAAIEEGRQSGTTLVRSIIKKGFIDENALINFLDKEMDFPRVDLSSYMVDKKVVNLVPFATAKKHTLIPLFKVGDVLTVATVDPFDVVAFDEVRARSKCDVEPMVATAKEIEAALNQYYGVAGSVDALLKNINPAGDVIQAAIPAGVPAEEAPIIKLVNL